MREIIEYWRHTLADANRVASKPQDLEQALNSDYFISLEEIAKGQINLALCQKLFKAKISKKDLVDGKILPLEVTLYPAIFSQTVRHGKRLKSSKKIIAPFALMTTVNKNGKLNFDRVPFVCRDYLAPARRELTIGDLESSDAFCTKNATSVANGTEAIKYLNALCEHVTGSSFETLNIPNHTRLDHGVFLQASMSDFTKSIQKTFETLLKDETITVPALQNMIEKSLSPHSELAKLSPEDQINNQSLHLGQMKGDFGLTTSQREALLHVLDTPPDPGDVLAINGPPGTGKTTLLQSIIASKWVEAALSDDETPPIIVASAATNQAMANVIDAFKMSAGAKTPKLNTHWLPDITELGALMGTSRDTSRLVYKDNTEHFGNKLETETQLSAAETKFTENFVACFPGSSASGIGEIKDELKISLMSCCEEIQQNARTLQNIRNSLIESKKLTSSELEFSFELISEYKKELDQNIQDSEIIHNEALEKLETLRHRQKDLLAYTAHESVWLSIFSWIPSVFEKRISKFKVFLLEHNEDISSIHSKTEFKAYAETLEARITAQLAKANIATDILQNSLQEQESFLADVSNVHRHYPDQNSSGEVWACLDKTKRFKAFQLARHFWEAAYLVEARENLETNHRDTKSAAKLRILFQRLSKLTPCFVSTLNSLPKHFTGWYEQDQITQIIDLLIIDEAGQAAPEIAAASLAFAKRAIIVGDEKQISPIRSLPKFLDRANFETYLKDVANLPNDSGDPVSVMSSQGTLMAMAQNASRFVSEPKFGRGMMLREHFRCYNEIIEFCDELVYQRTLKPQRGPKNPTNPLPAFGYAHIVASANKKGGSRENPEEARVIAQWIKTRQTELKKTYGQGQGKSEIGDILAVVTPYSAQTKKIQNELTKLGLNVSHRNGEAGITVGTLHRLQGAEKRVIIFSPATGYKEAAQSTFFGRDTEMLNVAVSRAQDSFLVFGNMDIFRPSSPDYASRVLGKYLLKADNEIVDVQPALRHVKAKPYQSLISDLAGHRALLKNAFTEAKDHVVVVSPFLTRAALTADNIFQLIEASRRRGVGVQIFTDTQLNKNKLEEFRECVETLKTAGAEVLTAIDGQGVHSKLLWVDRYLFVTGSFNWLSAARHLNSKYQRHETSAVFNGKYAARMIEIMSPEVTERCKPI